MEGHQAIQSRSDPTYIGMGLRTQILSDKGKKSEGLASDIELRFDILSVPLDETAPTVINHPTPALNVNIYVATTKMVNKIGSLVVQWKIQDCVP